MHVFRWIAGPLGVLAIRDKELSRDGILKTICLRDL